MHREPAALRPAPLWFLGSGCVDYSPCCTVLRDKFDEYNCSCWFDLVVLALVLWPVHFSFCQENVLTCQCLCTVQPLGCLLMNYLLLPESSLALLQLQGSRTVRGLWRWAHCSSPHSPAHKHSSIPGIFQPGCWYQVPQPGMLKPLQAFLPALLMHSEPSAKTRNSNSGFRLLSNSLGRALHIHSVSSCFLQHTCKGCLQAAQSVWWDV